MILYNVTVMIDAIIHHDWLDWMQHSHIPDVMRTGMFQSYRLCRLLDPEPEDGSITYAVQYFCEDLNKLHLYAEKYAPALQAQHSNRYRNQFVAIRSVLEIVS